MRSRPPVECDSVDKGCLVSLPALAILPAIDLKDGRCVRLRQGRAEDLQVYSEDPVAMAAYWEDKGAKALHVVDLDGAFRGRPAHTETILRIAGAVSVPVEVGGGLRTDADVRTLLDGGVARTVLGTRAFSQPEALAGLVRDFGPGIAVGIDARNGMVQVKGWLETTSLRAVDLAVLAADAGVKTLICTDTASDGMLTGVNVNSVAACCRAVDVDVIASGGVSSADDVRALRALDCTNLVGAIVGKALYEGKVSLEALLSAAG